MGDSQMPAIPAVFRERDDILWEIKDDVAHIPCRHRLGMAG
jgi:hypothetical protein